MQEAGSALRDTQTVVGAFDQVEEQFIYLFSSLSLRTLKNSASNSA